MTRVRRLLAPAVGAALTLTVSGCSIPAWVPLIGEDKPLPAGKPPAAAEASGPATPAAANLLAPTQERLPDAADVLDRVICVVNNDAITLYELQEAEAHYRHCLEELGKQPGMLGEIFKKARAEIQNPERLRRLIVDLIEPVKWSSMQADVKGDIYEGLLAKSAEESPKGAGQYFTPRQLIKGIVDCVQPTAADTVCDPAAGTGGFLLAAFDYVNQH